MCPKILEEIINTGSAIYSDFYLHVTLGRIKSEGIVFDDIRRLVDEVKIQPYTVYLREVVYRYFRGYIISKIILKGNSKSSKTNVQEEGVYIDNLLYCKNMLLYANITMVNYLVLKNGRTTSRGSSGMEK